MRKFSCLIAVLFFCNASFAQTSCEDYAVELTATVQETPIPLIRLNWKLLTADTPTYYIYKKAKSAPSFGTPIATLPSTDTLYVDSAVIIDSAYEYQVWGIGSTYNSSGYIYAGIRNPPIHNKGTMILLVDTLFTDSCAGNITTLMNDLSGDGWKLIRHDLSRNLADTAVRSLIASDYTTDGNVKSLLLLGHIAVPYCGDINPDGHPQHLGAWPADIYYGAFDATWTDVFVNDTTGSFLANWNVPGDGKFDQSYILSHSRLQIGRIDFFNMPAFAATEVQMMNNYLVRDHFYKMDFLNICHRAIISDNFGLYGEYFAANGWRNFPPLVTHDSIQTIPIIASLADSSFQWAYGCGGGSFTSAGGIGTSADFAANPVNGIFMMLFGSYFGDWNSQNNFLRAPLCSSTPALTDCWAARPSWFFHHMALGENIGYSALLTQNNDNSVYQPSVAGGGWLSYGAGWVHVALMGDPSLRTDYVKQISSLSVTTPLHAGAYLAWTASADTMVDGYYAYRADSLFGYYQRISPLISGTTFHDTLGVNGMKYYMIRPRKLQNTPSGRYYNLGVGVTDSAFVTYPTIAVKDVKTNMTVNIFPNPAKNYLNVAINITANCSASIYIINEEGQKFYPIVKQLNTGDNSLSVNVTNLAPGSYYVVINTGSDKIVRNWVKI